MNQADTAWMLCSTALVLLMTPMLAFFYGGLVRSKNALNTMMMSFISLGFVGVLWALLGYSLAFSTGNAWIGDARSEQDGRIRSPVLHSLIAIDSFERAITRLFAYDSPLRLFAEAVLFSHIAQRIRPTNAGDNRGK